MFSIIAINFFQLQAEQNGYLMAYFGIVNMVLAKFSFSHVSDKLLFKYHSCYGIKIHTGFLFQVIQGAVIGRLTSRFPEYSLLLFSIGLSSLVGLAQVNISHIIIIFRSICTIAGYFKKLDYVTPLVICVFLCVSGFDDQRVSVLFHCDTNDVLSQYLQCHHR